MTRRILVVDDHPINLKLACDVMEHEGYLVDRAGTADAALDCIERNLPDLILMDLGMPGMDGLALTRMLRSRESTRHILIVAVTAFAMKRDEERAMEAGCDAYIAKPIDTRRLPAQLAALMSESDVRAPNPQSPGE